LIEALAMLPSLAIALIYQDGDALAFVKTILVLMVAGLPAWLLAKPKERNLRAREGFVTVALAWVLLSLFPIQIGHFIYKIGFVEILWRTRHAVSLQFDTRLSNKSSFSSIRREPV
ncbi:MAG: hypothetical protein J6I42_01480, partial [Clostridia bacterium]|nr:hypothetical protein [Clostridia bacterium]